MTTEQKYWELREDCERAFDKYCGEQTEANLLAYRKALSVYQDWCMDILEDLMDNHYDALKNLKEW